MDNPFDVEFDSAGNLYIADTDNLRVRRVTNDGIISTFAGNGTAGFSGDGESATNAQFMSATGLSAFGDTMYVVDSNNNRVRGIFPAVVSPQSVIDSIQTSGLAKQLITSLIAPMKNVSKILGDSNLDNDEASCAKIAEFVANVQAKVASGKITSAYGAELLAQANSLRLSLGCV